MKEETNEHMVPKFSGGFGGTVIDDGFTEQNSLHEALGELPIMNSAPGANP